MNSTVSELLVQFAQRAMRGGVPEDVSQEAKRLLLNQLKASVGASTHPAVRTLRDWALAAGSSAQQAHMLWYGDTTTPQFACLINGALFEVLDFHDTYIPCFMHAVSAVLPALLASAEPGGQHGARVVQALAVGLEVELACATMLMPTGYFRGYVPAGLAGGIGAAAACGLLADLDDVRLRNAIGIAMCTAFGTYESVGSDTLAYITGATARSGLTAFELAARGMDAPRTAFEGEKGMFVTHSDESKDKVAGVLASLGKTWRIFGQSYKTVPTETITHAPVECVLEVLARARGRELRRMTFGVQPMVVKIADERRERFGLPNSELTARFDTRFCAAAAWVRGRFTLDEMREPAYRNAGILELRQRIDLVPDENRKTFEGCWLEASFTDGSTERCNVDYFLGSPGRRMTDAQLSGLFSRTAAEYLPSGRGDAILDAVWNLDRANTIAPLMSLARLS
jgi:2-methylcitrate dehydratase PrpD